MLRCAASSTSVARIVTRRASGRWTGERLMARGRAPACEDIGFQPRPEERPVVPDSALVIEVTIRIPPQQRDQPAENVPDEAAVQEQRRAEEAPRRLAVA